MLSGFCPASFGVLFCSLVLGCRCNLKLLDPEVSGARFLTGGVFECDIVHRRSVAALCILYKIRCNQMHPLNGALPGPHVPARVTRGALVAHRYTYAPLRCRTSQYSRTFIPFSVSLWNDLANLVFDGGQCFFIGLSCSLYPYYNLLIFFPFLFFLSIGRYCGAGVFGLIGCISHYLCLALPTFLNNNNNSNIENEELVHECFHKHPCMGTARLK